MDSVRKLLICFYGRYLIIDEALADSIGLDCVSCRLQLYTSCDTVQSHDDRGVPHSQGSGCGHAGRERVDTPHVGGQQGLWVSSLDL